MLQKGPETEKSLGLNPQLSWLLTDCLCGFDRNIPQLFFVFSLHLCLQRAMKESRYPLCYMAVVFDGMLLEFSPLFRLQPAAERKLITALPHGNKLEVGG